MVQKASDGLYSAKQLDSTDLDFAILLRQIEGRALVSASQAYLKGPSLTTIKSMSNTQPYYPCPSEILKHS